MCQCDGTLGSKDIKPVTLHDITSDPGASRVSHGIENLKQNNWGIKALRENCTRSAGKVMLLL